MDDGSKESSKQPKDETSQNKASTHQPQGSTMLPPSFRIYRQPQPLTSESATSRLLEEDKEKLHSHQVRWIRCSNSKTYGGGDKITVSKINETQRQKSKYVSGTGLSYSQMKAGRAIIKKYRKMAKNFEYKRLHSIIPSIANNKNASKMRILREAIRYIDSLHNQLVSQSGSSDTGADTIALVQRALQPGIEAKLEEKRRADQLAEKTLWQAAVSSQTPHQSNSSQPGTNKQSSIDND